MSLLATRMQNVREQSALDKNEQRGSRWGAWQLFKNQTSNPNGIISPELQESAARSIGNVLQVPVVNYNSDAVTVGGALTLTVPNVENTSAFVNVTFVSYSFGFHIHPAKHMNNEISMQRDFAAKLRRYELSLANQLDLAAITALEAAKTQVLSDDLGGRYSLTANVVTAPLAEQDSFVGDINPLMAGNDFYDMNSVIANPSLESFVRNHLKEKGEYNSENKTYQFADKEWYFSNNVTNAAANKATGFVVNGANCGVLQQFERDAILRSQTHKHRWDVDTLPLLGIPIGTYFYDDAIDGSALAGAATADMTRTVVQAHGFAGYFAFLTAYNSDAANLPSPIMKAAISKT